jgi:putative transposase
MLTEQEFDLWCKHIKFSRDTQSLIAEIRAAEPARRVKSGPSNVSGRYPSRKMGCTIQFESHRNELATILELEHDQTVCEYYDQPPSINLHYRSPSGKALNVLHTPDFFVFAPRDHAEGDVLGNTVVGKEGKNPFGIVG